MGGEKTAAMLPEPGPDLVEVRLRDFQARQGSAWKELETPFPMGRRQKRELARDLEEEEQPMAAPFIAVFADDASQVQVCGGDRQPKFFVRFAAGAGVGRFSFRRVQFPAAGTPQAEIRLLGAFHQEDFIGFIETVEQSGDLVGERHGSVGALER